MSTMGDGTTPEKVANLRETRKEMAASRRRHPAGKKAAPAKAAPAKKAPTKAPAKAAPAKAAPAKAAKPAAARVAPKLRWDHTDAKTSYANIGDKAAYRVDESKGDVFYVGGEKPVQIGAAVKNAYGVVLRHYAQLTSWLVTEWLAAEAAHKAAS